MENLDFGDGRVRVKGLSKTVRQLSKAGADADDLKDLMHSIGMLVVDAARPPEVTGALAGTIRAGRGKTKAVVRAGGPKAPYAGVIEYGDRARGKPQESYLNSALNAERQPIFHTLEEGIQALLKKNDLI
jgi:hypothetical protein